MIKSLVLFIILFSVSPLIAQSNIDKIKYKKIIFGEYRYFQNNKRLSNKQLKNILRNNEEAYKQYRDAQSYNVLSNAFGFIGGFMIGNTIADIVFDKEPDWQIGIIGASVILISIPIYSTANKQERYAVDYYNQFVPYSQNTLNELHFGICENGMGLKLKF